MSRVRRLALWLARPLAWILLVSGLVLALAWLYAFVATDSTLLGQLLWWGSLLLAGLSAGCLALAVLLRRAGAFATGPGGAVADATGRRPPVGADAPLLRAWRSHRRWHRARKLAWLAVVVMATGEAWHGLNMRSLLAPVQAVPAKSLLVVHWNSSVGEVADADAASMAKRLGRTGPPDVVLASIQNYHAQWEAIKGVMRRFEGEEIFFGFSGMQKVFSRYPIVSQRMFLIPVFLGTDGERVAPTLPAGVERSLRRFFRTIGVFPRDANRLDPASVMVVELDTTGHLGCLTTIYFVDYPSNPVAHRVAIARLVRSHMQTLAKGGPESSPVSPASLIIGDFNTPRGSASLGELAPGYFEASRTAGLGPLATWPRRWSVLHIDHALVSPRWRSEGYELIDPGLSEHDAQRVRIWPGP
jgi:hypothetical protein